MKLSEIINKINEYKNVNLIYYREYGSQKAYRKHKESEVLNIVGQQIQYDVTFDKFCSGMEALFLTMMKNRQKDWKSDFKKKFKSKINMSSKKVDIKYILKTNCCKDSIWNSNIQNKFNKTKKYYEIKIKSIITAYKTQLNEIKQIVEKNKHEKDDDIKMKPKEMLDFCIGLLRTLGKVRWGKYDENNVDLLKWLCIQGKNSDFFWLTDLRNHCEDVTLYLPKCVTSTLEIDKLGFPFLVEGIEESEFN